MNTHYVCPACGGVSDNPGACQTEGCSKKGHPLQECNCSDGRHENLIKKEMPKSTSENYSAHQLNVLNFALAAGITLGLYALFIGLAAWLFNWGVPLVELLSSWYLGFTATFLGSIVGAIWGFVDGLIGGVVFAWLYNKMQKK